MADNPIAGALSNLGRTFRDISTARLERQRLDLAGQREEAGQVRALEALRLQGQQQIAEQELDIAREQAAERQLTREFGLRERQFGLQEREARSLESFREGQLAVSRGGLEVSRQQAANQAAFQQGQLAIQQRQESRAERAFALNAETNALNKQILQNQLRQSNLSLNEQQNKLKQWDTAFPIDALRGMFLAQGVPQANVDAAVLGIETMKRAIAGPNTEVSDTITYGDAVTFGSFVTQAMKLVKTGNDQDVLKMAYELVEKVAGEDATPEERMQIAQELYLSLKDPQGTEQRFRTADYTRQVNAAMQAAAQQAGTTLERMTPEQRKALRSRVELGLQQSYQQSGRRLPAGVQPIAPAGPAGQPSGQPAPPGPAVSQPGSALVPPGQTPEALGGVSPAPGLALPPLLEAEVASGHTTEAAARAVWARALANTGGDVARAQEHMRLRGVGRQALEERRTAPSLGPSEIRRSLGIPAPGLQRAEEGTPAAPPAGVLAPGGTPAPSPGVPPTATVAPQGALAPVRQGLGVPGGVQTTRTFPGGIPLRDPYPSEDAFFQSRPEVAGMATADGSVILNPYSQLSETERQAVALNEAARVVMSTHADLRPDFALTPEQEAAFAQYGPPETVKATVAARLLSGDPSALQPTAEQQAFVTRLAQAMGLAAQATREAPPAPEPEGLPRLAPQQVQELEVLLARGGDPQAVVDALVQAGMAPEAARLAVMSRQLPALRQVLAEEAARRLQFGRADTPERVLRPLIPQPRGR